VSQEIVKAHEGTLELSSQPGVGTDAVVTLPAEAGT
jgi:signal transduction histidine kinase